ncbi:MAG: nitroreductase family protein [Treponema sp.]|jgi:nitroreductase|nr:nitroreductase family protein [Treponema sp.]
MKRTVFAVLLFAALCVFSLPAQSENRAGVMLSHYSTRAFATGAIPRADLELIVQTGVRAPSAVNRQPWHFTVVQDLELAKRIVPQTVEGNVLIIISAAGDSKTNTREIIDCALATQSVYLAAQALGYGSRIYTGPIDALNRNLKNEVGLPRNHSAVALVRIGRVEGNVDATSAASGRKAASDVVTYK